MNNLKEEMINQEIRNIVDSEIRGKLFPEGNFKEASVVLKRLYMKHYNKLNNVATKYAILYHLALAEYQLEEESNAKYYIEIIKNDAETSLWYADNLLKYCRLLNIFNETHKEEMSDEERKESYNYLAISYETLKNYSEKAMALANVYIIDKQFHKLLNLLEEIVKRNDNNVSYYSLELLKAIDENDSSLHNDALEIINKSNVKIG